ncbi:transposase [Aliihoeflea sp. PC F10.4]
MREWLTPQEIADARLPQLPLTKRGVNDLAEREGWNANEFHARKRAGRGGGMEYHIRLLPTLARVEYHSRHIVVGSPAMPAAANDEPTKLPQVPSGGRAGLERDARLAIVAQFERFRKGTNLRVRQAMAIFSADWNMGRIKADPWIMDIVPKLSRGSLERWASKKRYGQSLAVDRGAARKGTGILDTAENGSVRAFILGIIAHQPHLQADQIRDQVRAEFGDALKVVSKGCEKLVSVPPIRTFQRTIAELKDTEKVVLLKLTNPDHFRSTMKLAGVGTLRHITTPNHHWQIDASPVDALCTDGRHSVYVCIDIATRRVIILVSKTPRASAVALLIRKAIIAWGAPVEIKTDNGSDFTARSTKRLLEDDLKIDVQTSDAFSPEQKGFVERVIGSFQRSAVGLVPGFVGHSVSDRKAIESRKSFAQRLGEDDADTFAVHCTAAELQEHFDAWAEHKYQHAIHSALKRTPFEVAASADYTIRRVDERALDVLLAPIAGGDGTRIMKKTGFRVDNYHYLTGSVLPGTRALVRHDPADKGRIRLFSVVDESYLGEAICAELAGINPADWVKAQREIQSEIIREKTREIEKVRRGLRSGPALIERAREVWLRDKPNVVALPKREEQHVTPAITAALDVGRPDVAPPPSDETRAAQLRLIEEMSRADDAELERRTNDLVKRREREIEAERTAHIPAETNIVAMPETPKQRYRRAVECRRLAEIGQLDGVDGIWLGRYEQSAEFKAQSAIHEDFGDAYLS